MMKYSKSTSQLNLPATWEAKIVGTVEIPRVVKLISLSVPRERGASPQAGTAYRSGPDAPQC